MNNKNIILILFILILFIVCGCYNIKENFNTNQVLSIELNLNTKYELIEELGLTSGSTLNSITIDDTTDILSITIITTDEEHTIENISDITNIDIVIDNTSTIKINTLDDSITESINITFSYSIEEETEEVIDDNIINITYEDNDEDILISDYNDSPIYVNSITLNGDDLTNIQSISIDDEIIEPNDDGLTYDINKFILNKITINKVNIEEIILGLTITLDIDDTKLYGCIDDTYIESYDYEIDSNGIYTLSDNIINNDGPLNTDSNYTDYCKTLKIEGCTDSNYTEYDINANVDNGSCITLNTTLVDDSLSDIIDIDKISNDIFVQLEEVFNNIYASQDDLENSVTELLNLQDDTEKEVLDDIVDVLKEVFDIGLLNTEFNENVTYNFIQNATNINVNKSASENKPSNYSDAEFINYAIQYSEMNGYESFVLKFDSSSRNTLEYIDFYGSKEVGEGYLNIIDSQYSSTGDITFFNTEYKTLIEISWYEQEYDINNRIQTWDNTLPWVSPSIDDEIIDDSDISEEDDKNDGLLADITDNVDFINITYDGISNTTERNKELDIINQNIKERSNNYLILFIVIFVLLLNFTIVFIIFSKSDNGDILGIIIAIFVLFIVNAICFYVYYKNKYIMFI